MSKCPSLPIKWIAVIMERASERDLDISSVLLTRGCSAKLQVGHISPGFEGIGHYIVHFIGFEERRERWVILEASRTKRNKDKSVAGVIVYECGTMFF